MEELIAKKIYDYAKSGKQIDVDFVNTIAAIVINGKNLEKYVKFMCHEGPTETGKHYIAYYNSMNHEICMNHPNINLVISQHGNIFGLYEPLEQYMLSYAIVIQFLLHEIEHANQEKMYHEGTERSFESKLISACSEHDIIFLGLLDYGPRVINEAYNRLHKLKKEFYAYNPEERLANINSYSTLIEVFKHLKDKHPKLLEYFKFNHLFSLSAAHEDAKNIGICPTQVFLDKTMRHREWENFSFYSDDDDELIRNVMAKHTSEFRFKYGLPVSDDELEKHKEKILKSQIRLVTMD